MVLREGVLTIYTLIWCYQINVYIVSTSWLFLEEFSMIVCPFSRTRTQSPSCPSLCTMTTLTPHTHTERRVSYLSFGLSWRMRGDGVFNPKHVSVFTYPYLTCTNLFPSSKTPHTLRVHDQKTRVVWGLPHTLEVHDPKTPGTSHRFLRVEETDPGFSFNTESQVPDILDISTRTTMMEYVLSLNVR